MVDFRGIGLSRVRPVFKASLIAGQIFLLAMAVTAPARAENWVRSATHSQLGLDSCVDRDSIRRDADGFTHYRWRICQWEIEEGAIGEHAVRCSQILSGDLTIHTYRKGQWEQGVVIEGSMAAQTARFVCR